MKFSETSNRKVTNFLHTRTWTKRTWETKLPWLPPTDLSIKYGNLIYPKNVIRCTYRKRKWYLIFPASFSRHNVFSLFFSILHCRPFFYPFSLLLCSSLRFQRFSTLSTLMIRSIFNARSTFRTGAGIGRARKNSQPSWEFFSPFQISRKRRRMNFSFSPNRIVKAKSTYLYVLRWRRSEIRWGGIFNMRHIVKKFT